MSDEEVLANLFKSNFSTYQKADLSAGRGIGLDIIRSYVQCLRGKVKLLQSESGMKIEISFPVDIEDVIQPSGFHQIVSLLEDNFISNFPKEKVHVTLHDKSLVEDMIMGHKLFLDEMLKNISEYIIKQPFVWDQLFLDVFKLNGKRKIDFDNVYRVVIGINGEGLFLIEKMHL